MRGPGVNRNRGSERVTPHRNTGQVPAGAGTGPSIGMSRKDVLPAGAPTGVGTGWDRLRGTGLALDRTDQGDAPQGCPARMRDKLGVNWG
jgi:hypothetical protein